MRLDYTGYTKQDLIHVCRKYQIKGYSKLNKSELIKFIQNFFLKKQICRKQLHSHIDKNLSQLRKFKSRDQALAISYRNTIKNNKSCKLFYD